MKRSAHIESTFGRIHGFTHIELIAVLTVLGIISAIIVSQFFSADTSAMRAEQDKIKNHLRFAQSRAMGNNAVWGIQFATPTSYVMFEASSGSVRRIPGEDADSVNLSVLSITTTPQTIRFNGFGSPADGSGLVLASDIAVTTSGEDITITANTGFIP